MLKSMNSRFFVALCVAALLAWAPSSQAGTAKKKGKAKSVAVAKKKVKAKSVAVAKKKVRRAHERNRVKRLARESFRLHQQQLAVLDIVVMPKMGIETVPNAELHQQLQFAWQKLHRLAKKHSKIAPSPHQ
jgi:ribonuclease P protein component